MLKWVDTESKWEDIRNLKKFWAGSDVIQLSEN